MPWAQLHSQMVREVLESAHIQAIVPRKVWVAKTGEPELPFKYLVWLCYKMELERDLYLI